MDIKDRLKEVRDYAKMGQTNFEKHTGISVGYFNKVKGSVGSDTIMKIVDKFPELNIDWLITGKGAMLKSEQIVSMKERLVHFLKEEKIEIPDFCKSIGMPQAYYLSMKGNIPESKLKSIMEKYPQLSIEWLMTGEGKMIKPLENQSGDWVASTNGIESEMKPRIPYTAAAGSITNAVDGVTVDQCEQIPRINAFPEYDFTIIIKGNSMEPKYEGGDEVACKKINEKSFIQWGKVHVLDTAQGVLIKRVYEDGEKIRCASYNPEYPDFSIPKDDIFSMSLIVGLIRL